MLVISVFCFPLLLLGLMLSMDRVERPLRDEAVGERVVALLSERRAEEVESLVSTTAARAVDRHWRRMRRQPRLYVRRADDTP